MVNRFSIIVLSFGNLEYFPKKKTLIRGDYLQRLVNSREHMNSRSVRVEIGRIVCSHESTNYCGVERFERSETIMKGHSS